jgi:hypothetical protein
MLQSSGCTSNTLQASQRNLIIESVISPIYYQIFSYNCNLTLTALTMLIEIAMFPNVAAINRNHRSVVTHVSAISLFATDNFQRNLIKQSAAL